MSAKLIVENKALEAREQQLSLGLATSDDLGALARLGQFQQVGNHPTDELSNLILYWESVPKYCITGKEQARLRQNGFLKTVEKAFPPEAPRHHMTMHPARVQDRKTGTWIEYFPTLFDERVERALIKLSLESDRASFERINDQWASMIRFRIRDIRRILGDAGIEANHNDVVRALRVLAGTRLEVTTDSGKKHTESVVASLTEPKSKGDYYVARLNTIVTIEIKSRRYRQFPFETWMTLRRSISCWLLQRMILQRNIGTDAPHRVRVSDAEIAGVCCSKRIYDRVYKFYDALLELRERGVIAFDSKDDIEFTKIKESGKYVDAQFTLYPTNTLVSHVIAANARQDVDAARQALASA